MTSKGKCVYKSVIGRSLLAVYMEELVQRLQELLDIAKNFDDLYFGIQDIQEEISR